MRAAPEEMLAERVRRDQLEHRQDFVQLLRDLVTVESPSLDPESQKGVLDRLEAALEAVDYRTRRLPGRSTGGHLLGVPRARERGRPIQIMLGHGDTVWPLKTLPTMPWREEQGWIYGPGVYDMKAGLAMMIFALQTLKRLALDPPAVPVVFINSDEEIGSRESGRHIRRLARCASRAFILEPSLGDEGRLKTARKGVGAYEVRITGEAAHAGLEPDRGTSAILELSHVIQQLFALSDLEAGTSVNVGMIDGGLRPNVIAPESRARVDVRVLTPEEGERIARAVSEIRPQSDRATVTISGGIGRPPMPLNPRNEKLWMTARSLGRELGLELESGVAGGGSDGNTTSLFTATLDGLGAVGQGAHAQHEAIDLERTLQRAHLLCLLLMSSPEGV